MTDAKMSSLVKHWEARQEAIVRGDIPPRCPTRSEHNTAVVVSPSSHHHQRSSLGSDISLNDGSVNSHVKSDSSGHVREAFWMKLLEEQAQLDDSESFVHTVDDEDRSEEDFLSRRNSLVGKEIAPADYLEDGSPVSIASALNKERVCDDLKDAQIAKLTGMKDDNISTVASSVQHQSSVNLINETGRSFGDVTNSTRFNVAEPSKISNKIKIFQPETNQREKKDASWIKNNADTSKSPMKGRIDQSKGLSTPARVAMKKYLTPSPQPVVPKSKVGSTNTLNKLETVGPNPEDHNKFRWAYDIWYQGGLMKDNPRYSTTDPSFWHQGKSSRIRRSLARLSPEFSIDPDLSTTESNTSSSKCSSQGSSPTATKVLFKAPQKENSKPVGSVDLTDQGGFKHILNMWRDQSNETKVSKVPIRTTARPRAAVPKTPPKNVKSTIDFVAPGRSNSFPPKHPDTNKRLSPTQPSPKQFGELSAISVASSELVPYNFEASRNFSDQIVPSEKSFVDSDLYDYNQFYGGDSSKALVILQNSDKTYDVVVGETRNEAGEQLVIRNLENFAKSGLDKGNADSEQRCECSASVFSGNDDLIAFFLPQMGMACTCGQQRRSLVNPDDPTGIENVLRPWQCEFLRSFGIYRGEQLVHARHRSADILAKALRQWRKKHGMTPFKTSACLMALNIWSKTCKTYVRSIRKQILAGNQLLERRTGTLMNELSLFLNGLPEAPTKQEMEAFCDIEPESQVEV